VTQLVLGETADVVGREGDWLHLRTDLDRYDGWTHVGYLRELDARACAEWRVRARAFGEGAGAAVGGARRRIPLRARLILDGTTLEFPDGGRGSLIEGRVRPFELVIAEARELPAWSWALARFEGAPYEWGGVTPRGTDCSGLVQTTWLARGTALPRDAWQQHQAVPAVSLDAVLPDDLLFFRGETTDRITHVAICAPGDTIVHATIACGGVLREAWSPGSRAAALRERLVAAGRPAEVRSA
jgi:hypothetical protein